MNAPSTQSTGKSFSIEVSGGRRALLSVPEAGGAAALVVVLHGAGSTPEAAAKAYGFPKAAQRRGLALAFPEALPRDPAREASFRENPRVWRDGSGRTHTGETAAACDDLAFLAATVAAAAAAASLDPRRVLLTGFSNGASLAWRAGAERAGEWAAIAPVCGHLWQRPSSTLPKPPALFLAGDADPLHPAEGGRVRLPWGAVEVHPPWQRSVDLWTEAGGVVTYRLLPGQGHEWPGGVRLLPEATSGPTSTYRATEAILDFFEVTLGTFAGAQAALP